MAWTINYTDTARRLLRKMDRNIARKILDYMDYHIAVLSDPRQLGKSLKGPLDEYWRYRIGDWRIICDIQDDDLCVLVVRIGNRREIYR